MRFGRFYCKNRIVKVISCIESIICNFFIVIQVAEVTFNFWYRLSEALFKEDNNSKNDIFKPYVDQLFSALLKHSQMEPDFVRY